MSEQVTWPAPLVAPATIAVVSPSGPVPHAQLDRGIARMEARGFTIKLGDHAKGRYEYLSGTDAERLADLHAAWADPEVDAVWCARGGYGAMRLLDSVDWDSLARPLPLIGYSDITALHLAIQAKFDRVGFSGPMLGTSNGYGMPDDLDPASDADLWAWIGDRELPRALANPYGEPLTVLREGVAEGRLVGGNLALVAALVGTPYLPDLSGTILVVEDVGEYPYRIDRMLTQLRLSGDLDRIAGIILGDFDDCFPPVKDEPGLPLDELVIELLGDRDIPVVSGLRYGHIKQRCTVPLGAMARLSTSGPEIVVTG